jgi:hypothetical protein
METLEQAKADTVLNLGDTSMTARDIRRILCDAHVLPAVMGGESKPLDVAVPSYVVPAHMRRGLVLRDKGCAFPGCEKPASACDSHHLREVRHEARVVRVGVRDLHHCVVTAA